MRASNASALTQIYQNLRTISFLPSVRKIDRHLLQAHRCPAARERAQMHKVQLRPIAKPA